MSRVTFRCLLALGLVWAALEAGPSSVAARDPMSYDDLDTMLDLDPLLPIPANLKAFDPALTPIWTATLSAPEADLRRRAAETIGIAHSYGMEGLEIAVEPLTRLAGDPEEDRLVRLSAVQTLVHLDARSSAATLAKCAAELGAEAVHFIYPALARWDHGASRDTWLKQLQNPATLRRERIVALLSLGEVREAQAEPILRGYVIDVRQLPDVRLHAARALARVQTADLLQLANTLAADQGPEARLERILAVSLLREHTGPEIENRLAEFALDAEPAVANLALARLIELSPPRVAELAPQLLTNRDANCRRWAARAVGMLPSPEHCIVLGPVMNDPHPEIRVFARQSLLEFATKHNLASQVIEVAVQVLQGDDWRGIEQSSRIVGMLDHKPAAPRLVEVLYRDRIEEKVTAAWALRKLAVPETLDPVFAYTQEVSRYTVGGEISPRQLDYNPVLTQLFQLFGLLDYQQCEPLLRRYIPKNLNIVEARSGAIWAMGHFHRGQPDPDLVPLLEARLADTNSNPPEHDRVRQLCAVALGRMKAEAALPTLRKYYELNTPNSPCGYACGWAIEQITGERCELPMQLYDYRQGWFLTPLK